MAELSKQYDPAQHEESTYKRWEDANVFAPSEKALKSGRKPFVIMLPPPNITGSLHMGHALQDTIMDILTRWHRMMGDPTLWLPGTDHAALPTNKIINDQLAAEGTDRFTIGRQSFMQRTEDWYKKVSAEILHQMRRLGASCDWSRQRFTMDKEYYRAVQEAFVRYYERGYIYRGARIVNWDPKSQTTVSDLEIDWQTETAPFYTFKYGPFEISTARPETKFGDKYVVMHPDDKRYQQYKHGDTFQAEWINGPITATIIKDEAADPEFGTGVMTITPWHDATDFAIAQRHSLDMEQIIGFDGNLLPIAGEFEGMNITEARPKIVAKLESKGLLVQVDENYQHNVALNDRGKGMIEPQIMRQWFLDMQKIKPETINVAQENLISFIPPRWKKHFIDWMEGVWDWNINRQIWLGHRLPVWWKKGTHSSDSEAGNFVVSIDPPNGENGEEWEQDPDVLDTWFSSALWPFATLGWPDDTADLKTFYPSTVLVTARDILYLWVARMVFSGLEFMQGNQYGNRKPAERIPFEHVYIHPTVLAKDGQRMSKTLGTGVDPLDLINQYGADATRFGLMYQMSYDSQAIKFDEDAIRASRNFANKVWNIARFLDSLEGREEESIADTWIKNRLDTVAHHVTKLLGEYRFGEAASMIQDFVWKEYADWYIEIVKHEGATTVAREVFTRILQLLHPYMPHITEVLWSHSEQEGMIAVSDWFYGKQVVADTTEMDYFIQLVSAIRTARSLLEIKPSSTITISTDRPTPLPTSLKAMARIELIEQPTNTMRKFPVGNTGAVYLGSDEITAASLERVRTKLTKEQDKNSATLEQLQTIVANMQGKAPQEKITAKELQIEQLKSRQTEITKSLELLQ